MRHEAEDSLELVISVVESKLLVSLMEEIEHSLNNGVEK